MLTKCYEESGNTVVLLNRHQGHLEKLDVAVMETVGIRQCKGRQPRFLANLYFFLLVRRVFRSWRVDLTVNKSLSRRADTKGVFWCSSEMPPAGDGGLSNGRVSLSVGMWSSNISDVIFIAYFMLFVSTQTQTHFQGQTLTPNLTCVWAWVSIQNSMVLCIPSLKYSYVEITLIPYRKLEK